MSLWRDGGLLAASAALAGGVAYVIWSYASSSRGKESKTNPERHCKPAKVERGGEPSAGEPVEPSAGEPGELSAGEPVGPSAEEPGEPSAGEPGKPSAGEPGEPSAGEPVGPSAGEPGEPSAGEPGEPSAGEPSPEEPGEPSAGEPGEPSPEEPVVSAVTSVPVAAEAQRDPVTESRGVEKGTQVLVLGLDGAGKTSLLHCFALGGLEQEVEPTEGFNAVSINREDLQIEFLEIGGKENLRPYWQKYMSKALVLVFVVDSSNADLFPLAKKHLHDLVAPDPRLPLVVLANKQDLPGSCSITDLHDALSLAEVGDQRRLFLIGTHVRKGDPELSSGVQDARDLIVQMVSGR